MSLGWGRFFRNYTDWRQSIMRKITGICIAFALAFSAVAGFAAAGECAEAGYRIGMVI
jgi:hypothetical protein